jgi:glycosyltransferase involved in cell wall biosynthesis
MQVSTTNSTNELKAFLAVDDLRVGGIQRLAMDEAYALAEDGYNVQIINFGADRESDSIIFVDGMTKEALNQKSIYITNFSEKKLFRFFKLRKFIIENEVDSIICHSPSASLWVRIAAISIFRRVYISLWIHQVLTLSDLVQAFKRVMFSTTADKIFFSALQFKLEWEANPADKLIRKIRGNQNRSVDRLGVHIPRVLSNSGGFGCEAKFTHLVYASRLTPWKGLEKFDKIIERNPDYHPVILTVNVPEDHSSSTVKAISQKDHLLICKSPSSISNVQKAVHIYPTHYGKKVKNPQSVGLNVMEFAVLGIPSLISPEVTSTYPEILESILVESVDWHDDKLVDKKILLLANLTENERRVAADEIQAICSIRHHLDTIKLNL